MASAVTIGDILTRHNASLDLCLVLGDKQANLLGDNKSDHTDPIGHLNVIHPNRIQVLGRHELRFLANLGKNSLADTLKSLFEQQPKAIVVADGAEVPKEIRERAEQTSTPVLTSNQRSSMVINHLRYILMEKTAGSCLIHGVFLEILGRGVLITGDSGIGKSELALELISRGHRLIADDMPEFKRIAPDIIDGTCPVLLRDFIEVRGLGILNVRSMFGDSSVKHHKYLRLVVKLVRAQDLLVDEQDRLGNNYRTRDILGVAVPEVTLPVATGRNLAVLVETAVRNHMLFANGYNSAQDFIEKQRSLMQTGEQCT